MIGEIFGKLKVVSFAGKKGYCSKYLCRCSCGNEKVILDYNLRSGNTKSCGCSSRYSSLKHGGSGTTLFTLWCKMKQRCYDSNVPEYKNYGGRGIEICNEWMENFGTFYVWAIENGYEKGLEIDRKDNNGDYGPANCRFVTRKQNSRNRRTTLLNPVRVAVIKRLYSKGFGLTRISKLYSVKIPVIFDVVHNKTWV